MHQLRLVPRNPEFLEALAGLISSLPNEGVQELDEALLLYVQESDYESPGFRDQLTAFSRIIDFEVEQETLPEINWNEAWETYFDPVTIGGFLTIRAGFHPPSAGTEYEIVIEPKMSFGTGHHATTWMMARAMSMLDFQGREVLDAGSGTGILAILALKLGAVSAVGFDNDVWCYRNAQENAALNNVTGSAVWIEGDLKDVPPGSYDVVLANINRNYLLDHAEALALRVRPGGFLLVSGFYDREAKLLLDRYAATGFVAQHLQRRDDWACIIFVKNP